MPLPDSHEDPLFKDGDDTGDTDGGDGGGEGGAGGISICCAASVLKRPTSTKTIWPSARS